MATFIRQDDNHWSPPNPALSPKRSRTVTRASLKVHEATPASIQSSQPHLLFPRTVESEAMPSCVIMVSSNSFLQPSGRDQQAIPDRHFFPLLSTMSFTSCTGIFVACGLMVRQYFRRVQKHVHIVPCMSSYTQRCCDKTR